MNRVWIELDRPSNDAEGNERAALLSKMLGKLGVTYSNPVFWYSEKARYCFVVDEAGAYMEASDNGFWYNLDFLAKED